MAKIKSKFLKMESGVLASFIATSFPGFSPTRSYGAKGGRKNLGMSLLLLIWVNYQIKLISFPIFYDNIVDHLCGTLIQ